MKTKQILSFTIIVCVFISLSSTCFSINNKNLYEQSVCDNYEYIKIKNIEIINEKVDLNKAYNNYVIITMTILNKGLEDMELSNINCYAYQKNKNIETFIQSKNNYLGFVGKISSGEEKIIKICVGLDNVNSPIKLVFENLSYKSKKMIINDIKI